MLTYNVLWNFDYKQSVVTVTTRVPSDWVIEQLNTFEFLASLYYFRIPKAISQD